MTNNTIPNVPRELLEHLIEQHITAHGCTNETARKAQLLLSAPSPAGVDGLEVVAWVTTGFSGKSRTRRAFTVNADDAARQHTNWTPHYRHVTTDQLCRLSDAQAIIDGLRGEVGAQRVKTCIALKERNDAREERDAALAECERLRMQLAACGVVALANTIESAGEARQMHPDYMSASCSDVADAVDREIALRTERDQQAQRIGELAELAAQASVNCKNTAYYLRKYRPDLADICSGWCVAIDAALSAGKEGE